MVFVSRAPAGTGASKATSADGPQTARRMRLHAAMVLAGGVAAGALALAGVRLPQSDNAISVPPRSALTAAAAKAPSADELVVFIVESEDQASQVREAISNSRPASDLAGMVPEFVIAGTETQAAMLQA
jgi:hypothetical protein